MLCTYLASIKENKKEGETGFSTKMSLPMVNEGTEFIVAVSNAPTANVDLPLVNGANKMAATGPAVIEDLELPVGEGEGEMIYLLVEDGADPNLENQTLYIDPSQLQSVLQNADGTMLLQQPGSVASTTGGQLIIQNADGALSNLVILDNKV